MSGLRLTAANSASRFRDNSSDPLLLLVVRVVVVLGGGGGFLAEESVSDPANSGEGCVMSSRRDQDFGVEGGFEGRVGRGGVVGLGGGLAMRGLEGEGDRVKRGGEAGGGCERAGGSGAVTTGVEVKGMESGMSSSW